MANLATRASVTLTVPNDAAAHSLFTLISAIQPICPTRTRWMTIQVPATSAGTLLIGDGPKNEDGTTNPSALTATNVGLSIAAGAAVEYFYGISDADFTLTKFYVLASGGAVTVNVQIIRA